MSWRSRAEELREQQGGRWYPTYADDELERLCPYCLNGSVELDEATYEGDCDACGRHVTFEGPEAEER